MPIDDDMKTCDYDGKPHSKRGRFCSDKCRATWHREHDPSGVVRSVRKLRNGGTAVIVHFDDQQAERAFHFHVRQAVVLGAIDPPQPTTSHNQPE